MHVILKTVGDHEGVRRIVIRAGQTVRVGSTEWADFCISDDPGLRDEHFSVGCDSKGCCVESLGGAETLVNDEPVDRYDANDGDTIQAGRTSFRLEFFGFQGPRAKSDLETVVDDLPPPKWPNLQQQQPSKTAETLSFRDAAMSLIAESDEPESFLMGLLDQRMIRDTLQYLSHVLPPRSAVWWGAKIVEAIPSLNAAEQDAVSAALQWCAEPNDENREACRPASEACDADSPAGAIALAAASTGGSMLPAEMAHLPPPPTMTPAMVLTALARVCSAESDAAAATQRFAEQAIAIAKGEVPWDYTEDVVGNETK